MIKRKIALIESGPRGFVVSLADGMRSSRTMFFWETSYRVDVSRYDFLATEHVHSIRRFSRYP